MAQTAHVAQAESFRQKVKIALVLRGKDINWLAARLARPQPSVSKAINQDVFPLLRKEIAGLLGIKI
jgi:hypothetical protein